MADMPVECGNCGAHFALDPSGSVQGAACSECGGTRFFRTQVSPTQSDGTLRNTPEPGQPDPGGNPLGEGTIVGDDHEKPAFKRDNFMHGKVAWNEDYSIHDWGDSYCPNCQSPMGFAQGQWHCPGCKNTFPDGWHNQEPASHAQHPDPWMDNEPGATTFPQHWVGKVAYPNEMPMIYEQEPTTACPICGKPIPRNNEGAFNLHFQQEHQNGVNFGEPANATHAVAKRVEPMRTSNTEPYPSLWDDLNLPPKTAGPLAVLPFVGEGAADLLAGGAAAGAADAGAAGAADAAEGTAMGGGLGGLVKKALPKIMQHALGMGGQQGTMAPQAPTPAPNAPALASVDIPMVLAAAPLETPHSVKSIGNHDDPEKVDPKEFNDQSDSSSLRNPNMDDSGASGEDAVREHAGFGPDSPGAERAMMILPLLLHYVESPDSGQNDPLIRALHESLEQESPGYLNQDVPDGDQLVQTILQHHKSPKSVHAGVNMDPMGAMPGGMPGGQGGPMDANPGGGRCPNCGGVLAGDGSCPQCGAKQHPQGGAQLPAGGGVGVGNGTSMPPNAASVGDNIGPRMANNVGPQTPEQKAAVIQLLIQQKRLSDIPNVELHPEQFSREMAQIQGNPNIAPLVDPSQQQQTPPPDMMNPPGGMPVMDPSQAGGGGMPMQPMSHTAADSVAPRCPHCNSGSTGLRISDGQDGLTAECSSCGKIFDVAKKLDIQKYKANVVLADVPNPLLAPAADQHQRHERGHDPSLTWMDEQGQPLMENQIYALKSPNWQIPDMVQVVYVHPDEVGVKLVGQVSNIATDPTDNRPDFKITPQQMKMQQMTFEPQQSDDTQDQQPQGTPDTTPGMAQIPPSGPTTDQQSNSYPNPGTVSQVIASDDRCHQCGCDWIDHVTASATRTMHECARCGAVWETDNDTGDHRPEGLDLSWILSSSNGDDFHEDMERARAMAASSGPSRSLAAAASKDNRYQQVREVLERNKQERSGQRTAGRHFTPSEQRELVNERGTARNADLLDLTNTHYEARYDYTGKANGANVPDEHLFLGL